MYGGRRDSKPVSRVVKLAAAATLVLALVALWRYTPLAGLTDPETLKVTLESLGGGFWLPLMVFAAYLVGGLVVFPVTVLIAVTGRSEEHTSELQSLMRISSAVFCLKKQ